MHKFLLLAVILSLLLSTFVEMSIITGPRSSNSIDDSEGSSISQDFGFIYYISKLFATNPKSTEDEPEKKPQDKPEPHKEDHNMAGKLNDSMKVTTENTPTESSGSTVDIVKELSYEYLTGMGIGAHKLHLRRLSWNNARKVCIDAKGQLTDITSESEEKMLMEVLDELGLEFAWVGYHDMFEKGDWVSVMGEPLGKSGLDSWWKKRLLNPDNGSGKEDCASLMRNGEGMTDYNCRKELPFICKITTL